MVIAIVPDLRTGEDLRGRYTLLLVGRDDAALHGGVDRRCGRTQVQSALRRPLAGALLLGLVQDDVHQRLPRLFVQLGEDVRCNLDEVGFQLAAVPFGEDLMQLRRREATGAVQDVVGFGDELHVTVLDAVVHHLDVVAGATRADVGDARLAVHFGRDGGENRLQHLPGTALSARHDARSPQRAVLSAGDAAAQVEDASRFQILGAPLGVAEEGVATINEQVSRIE